MALSQSDRQEIRNHVRRLRRGLSTAQQTLAADSIAEHALHIEPVDRAQHIALFLSVDGELNTRPLIARLWQQQKQVYLPVLHPFSPGNLIFVRYTPETILSPNRVHIPEPPLDVRHIIPLDELDVMFVPLVAFDRHGQRLGMGGGFYDRTLQNWQEHRFLPIGLAHDCQRVEKLPSAEWDIPLPAILTPSHFWQWEI
ncbi:5-formyltetrahydrofolate cyclo-ligase [Mixta intestinalis]|uniref:5-formyltetrahydrofolate cyclo-ligase n=1 Tax=Mixta intestinalis TaxID=1615494 RepID=A0A6P1Q057_9GAMM|nr:5-formyltetrahydrofolate cyclo-ligase [Mixta intestinalis]QHM72316.1 5-formyltetrahydrofolate cyclo-ligase [Mixta intestinalis]